MLNPLTNPVTTRPVMTAQARHDAPEWTLPTIIAILLRRLRLILAIVAICVALAVLYLVLAEPHFTATATLLPDVKRSPPAPNEVVNETLIDPAVVENQIEIIKSNRIALAVVDKLRLQDDPEFGSGRPRLLTRVINALLPAETARVPSAERKRRAAATTFGRMLKVNRVGRSYLTNISFTSTEPMKSASIANEVAEAYIQDQLGAKFASADRSARWMRERITELEREAAELGKAIEDLNGKLRLDASGMPEAVREHEALTASLERAKSRTAQAQAQAERAQAALRDQDPEALPDSGFLDALQDPKLTRLRAVYRATLREAPSRPLEERGQAPADPELAEKLAEQRKAIWEAVRAAADAASRNLESARLSEAALARRAAELAPPAAEAREMLQRADELNARQESSRQLHGSLQHRFARVNQFAQQQSVPVTEARLIAAAVPPRRPSSPKALLILLLAVSAGLTAGAGTALTAEYLDRRIRRTAQIGEMLGLPSLGAVQRFGRGAGGAKTAARPLLARIARWLAGPAGETLRGVKVAIDSSSAPTGARVVAVVSPNDGEGKTTIALALALLAARGGKRVLLIDADLRERSLTRTLTPKATGGLATTLQQYPTTSEEPARHELGFRFLGQAAELGAAHPSDILGSDAMQEMIEDFRKSYDYVVVDTPALLPHVDVAAAAGLFDAFVMVIESGRTRIDELVQAVSRAAPIGERLVGVLINKAPRGGR
jgi:succinoglycan biosynthesis transport protein ExoP